MPVASTPTIALDGAVGHVVDVQADVSQGQAGLTLVGRSDVSLNEAPHRCRMAIVNTGLLWPASRRITILLSPSDLPKRGTHFDLAIALAVLKADQQLPAADLAGSVFLGELTLSGGLRSVPGVLPMTLAATRRGLRRVFVPEPQAHEAAMVPGVEVLGIRSLGQVVALLSGEEVPDAPPVAPMSASRLLSWRGEERLDEVDLADVHGMHEARYAAEVAAAGGHHLLLSGPKGCGKTTLAERIPTVLPDLTTSEAIELTALHSLAGALREGDGLIRRPPFCAPHHDASKASILGGGTGRVRPGEVSRAHCGVLLLDEFPLLRTDVIDALRQPSKAARSPSPAATSRSPTPPAAWWSSPPTPAPAATTTPTPAATAASAPRRNAATTSTGSAARSPTGSTSPATSNRCDPMTNAIPGRRPSPPPSSGSGSPPPATARRRGTPTAPGGSTGRPPATSSPRSGRWPARRNG